MSDVVPGGRSWAGGFCTEPLGYGRAMDTEQRERLELMAEGNPKWDLSENDCAALRASLERHQQLLVVAQSAANAVRLLDEHAEDQGLTEVRDEMLRGADELRLALRLAGCSSPAQSKDRVRREAREAARRADPGSEPR